MPSLLLRRIRPTLLLLAAMLAACGERERSGQADGADAPPHLIVLLLDTVRADRLGAYGGPPGLTPELDAFASESTLFEDCSSVSCWTLPSHASLFTGLLPIAHQATQESLRLDDAWPTLAELLGAAGYLTYGASANAVVGPSNGLDRGFAHFEELYRDETLGRFLEAGRHPHEVAFERWLDARGDAERPVFAFFNFIEAHAPYRPATPFLRRALAPGDDPAAAVAASRTRIRDHYVLESGLPPETLAWLSKLYDGEIASLDWAFARMRALLETRGLWDDAIVVVTADHGEAFGEHGLVGHSFSLYETHLRVPLIVRRPGSAGARVAQPVQLHDLFPTLLNAAGAPLPDRVDGVDLFAAPEPDRVVFAEYYYPAQVLSAYSEEEFDEHLARFAPYLRRIRAARQGAGKLILGSDGRHEFFRLDADPGERSPAGEPAAELRALLASFEERWAGPAGVPPVPPPGWRGAGFEATTTDPELLEKLRALGYVD